MSRERQKLLEDKDKRKRQRLQLLLWQLEVWMNAEDTQGMILTHVTVRTGSDRGGEVLVIAKALFEGRPYVGFHSAAAPEDALLGALERIRNNDLKWREDKPLNG